MKIRFQKLLPLFLLTASLVFASGGGVCLGREDFEVQPSLSYMFGLYAAEGIWSQRCLTVSNRTDAAADMKAMYVTQTKDAGLHHFYRPVIVPANSRRLITLSIKPESLPAVGDKPAKRAMSDHTCLLLDSNTDKPLCKPTSAALPSLDPNTTVVASLTGSYIRHDEDQHLSKMLGSGRDKIARVSVSETQMPDKWYGYSIIDLAFVRGLRADKMRPSQIEALLDWVRRGGVVILCADETIDELLTGPLGRAAGVTAVGFHQVADLKVTNLDKKPFKKPIKLHWPMPMAELLVKDATVLFSANSLPLVTQKSLGDGQVFTLAVPVAGLKDKQFQSLWWRIRRAANRLPAVNHTNFISPARQALLNTAGRRVVSFTWPVVTLLVLAGATVLIGLVARRYGSPEMAWFFLIPAAAIAGAVFYGYALARTDSERLSCIGMVSAWPNGRARVQGLYQYYSGGGTKDLTLAGDGPLGLIDRVGKTHAGPRLLSTAVDEAMTISESDISPNSTRGFYTDGIGGFKCVTGTMSFDDSGLCGALENHFEADLTDAVIYVNRRSYRLGILKAEEITNVSVSPADRLGDGEFTGGLLHSPQDIIRNEMLGRLTAWSSNIMQVMDRKPVIVGYLPGRAIHAADGWSVVVQGVELVRPKKGSSVVIPSAFVELDFRGRGRSIFNPLRGKFIPSFGPADLLIFARLPSQVTRLAKARGELKVQIQAAGYRMGIFGIAPDGKRVKLAEFADPDGALVIKIDKANRFRRADGRYALVVKIELKNEKINKINQSEPAAQWQMENIELILKGVCP